MTTVEFVDCTSVSISYDIMGIATVSYTIISNTPTLKAYDRINLADRVFSGYIASVDLVPIPSTNFYENRVTLISTVV